MNCKKCGKSNPEKAVFCAFCGKSLIEYSKSQKEYPQQKQAAINTQDNYAKKQNPNPTPKSSSDLFELIAALGYISFLIGSLLLLGAFVATIQNNSRKASILTLLTWLAFIPTNFIETALQIGFPCFIVGGIIVLLSKK